MIDGIKRTVSYQLHGTEYIVNLVSQYKDNYFIGYRIVNIYTIEGPLVGEAYSDIKEILTKKLNSEGMKTL